MLKLAIPLIPLLVLGACVSDTPTSPDVHATRDVVAASSVTTVMSELNSPRGLAWGPEGGLYVAEAGTTGPSTNCIPGGRGNSCLTSTGSVTRLWKGKQERVVEGLPSVYNASNNDIGGPHDVSFVGRGNAKVSIGLGGPPSSRAGFGAVGAQLGTVLQVKPSGGWKVAADVSAFEGANNPAGGPIDSNPYGLLAEPSRTYVTDAGGNSLLEISASGKVSLVAVFPSFSLPPLPMSPPFAEAVPTEVTRGPDGALYVSTLTGFPFFPGVAAIYRVMPGQAPTIFAMGFTQITDFDWGPDGSMYVLQYAAAPFFGGLGSIIRVAPNGGARTTITASLTRPTGIVVGPDGALYVSNRGNQALVGEVLRIVP